MRSQCLGERIIPPDIFSLGRVRLSELGITNSAGQYERVTRAAIY
jgi:hypothetical protein